MYIPVAAAQHQRDRARDDDDDAGSCSVRRYDGRLRQRPSPLLNHPLDLELLARQTQFAERVAWTAPLMSLLNEEGSRQISEEMDPLERRGEYSGHGVCRRGEGGRLDQRGRKKERKDCEVGYGC